MSTCSFAVLLITIVIAANVANAEIYKWVDENGQTHYSTIPPNTQKADEVEVKTNKVDQANANRLNQQTVKYNHAYTQSKNKSSTKKSTSNNKSKSKTTKSEKQRDKERCEEYKDRYKRYKKDGVMGINPVTGQKRMMTGEGKRTAIQNAKENAEIFCS